MDDLTFTEEIQVRESRGELILLASLADVQARIDQLRVGTGRDGELELRFGIESIRAKNGYAQVNLKTVGAAPLPERVFLKGDA